VLIREQRLIICRVGRRLDYKYSRHKEFLDLKLNHEMVLLPMIARLQVWSIAVQLALRTVMLTLDLFGAREMGSENTDRTVSKFAESG
jgi:hypothetical protein